MRAIQPRRAREAGRARRSNPRVARQPQTGRGPACRSRPLHQTGDRPDRSRHDHPKLGTPRATLGPNLPPIPEHPRTAKPPARPRPNRGLSARDTRPKCRCRPGLSRNSVIVARRRRSERLVDLGSPPCSSPAPEKPATRRATDSHSPVASDKTTRPPAATSARGRGNGRAGRRTNHAKRS